MQRLATACVGLAIAYRQAQRAAVVGVYFAALLCFLFKASVRSFWGDVLGLFRVP